MPRPGWPTCVERAWVSLGGGDCAKDAISGCGLGVGVQEGGIGDVGRRGRGGENVENLVCVKRSWIGSTQPLGSV